MEQSLSGKLAGIVLPDFDGHDVRLGSLWADRASRSCGLPSPLRLSVLPRARRAVARARGGIPGEGRTPGCHRAGRPALCVPFREETGITFPLLIDERREAYRAAGLRTASLLHILRRDNARARQQARAAGHRQHRRGRNPFQLGGSFVFGPGNVDRFAHVSETFGDNASPTALLAGLP